MGNTKDTGFLRDLIRITNTSGFTTQNDLRVVVRLLNRN